MMERKRYDVFLFEKEDFLRRREGAGSRAPVPRREEAAGRELKRPAFLAPDGGLAGKEASRKRAFRATGRKGAPNRRIPAASLPFPLCGFDKRW